MKETKVEISPLCEFVATIYGDEGGDFDVSLDYTERSPDSWYSDQETTVTIDREKAVEIIEFLQQTFSIKPT